MNLEGFTKEQYTKENLKSEDKWILTKLNNTIKEVTKNMDKYEFNNAGAALYNFIWSDFCDNYIEIAKFSLDDYNTKTILLDVITAIIKMLHPFMPYVTDEIYSMLPIKDAENIMISNYPTYDKTSIYIEDETIIDDTINFVKVFRNIKAENNIPSTFEVTLDNDSNYELIIKMLKLTDNIVTDKLDKNSYEVQYKNYKATIYYEKEITEEDIKLKEKQIETLKNSIERRKNLLANENYVSKAPAHLVEVEKAKLAEEEKQLESLIQ